MMTASLKSSLDLASKKLSDCKATTASLTESSGKATGELAETKKSKLADSMYLDNLKLECSQAAKEWAEHQKRYCNQRLRSWCNSQMPMMAQVLMMQNKHP